MITTMFSTCEASQSAPRREDDATRTDQEQPVELSGSRASQGGYSITRIEMDPHSSRAAHPAKSATSKTVSARSPAQTMAVEGLCMAIGSKL